MADLSAVRDQARFALERAVPLASAEGSVPGRPGLYAIYSDANTWNELTLGDPPDARPLYIGKAEDSLAIRVLKTHFGDGRTGQSTVRRSFAALLHDTLGLRGIPRNPDKPAYFSNYGLSASDDATLTSWMREHLRHAVWPKPSNCEFTLDQVETALLVELAPPLNIKDVVTPWRAKLEAARAVMAGEARQWTLSSEPKCNTPADLIIGMVDQDLRECCHAMLFAFVE